jgi:hypothetical protein
MNYSMKSLQFRKNEIITFAREYIKEIVDANRLS